MESRFVKVKCQKCKNEQTIFGKASSKVKCTVCETIISEPSGGKSRIKGKIIEILG
jgi:small subunit ribosomal protein S27e